MQSACWAWARLPSWFSKSGQQRRPLLRLSGFGRRMQPRHLRNAAVEQAQVQALQLLLQAPLTLQQRCEQRPCLCSPTVLPAAQRRRARGLSGCHLAAT